MRTKDFVEEARMNVLEFSPPVRSLLDTDFYKLTMGQLIRKHFPDVEVRFELIVRDKDVELGRELNDLELRRSFDYIADRNLRKSDLYYLRGMDLYEKYMFSEDYLDYLKNFRLPAYHLERTHGGLKFSAEGKWSDVSMWETIALAIISELYYRSLMRRIPQHELMVIYSRATDRIYRKLEELRKHKKIRFADFGQRRRHSFLWQEFVIGLCKDMLPGQFMGTSNTWMAFHHDVDAIGTSAHELTMVLTALADNETDMLNAQYEVLRLWQDMYGQGLRIFLPDTYGSAQFFKNAPSWLTSWRGQRQDSGDPIVEANRYSKWLLENGENPKDHITIFSDGLDKDSIINLDNVFGDSHRHSFGWGTFLTNDFAGCHEGNKSFRPFSMVCKVVSANGRPCVKLSNNTHKATGPKDEIAKYLNIFGGAERSTYDVVV